MRPLARILGGDNCRRAKHLKMVIFLARHPLSAPGAIIVPFLEPSSHARKACKTNAYKAAEETHETIRQSSSVRNSTTALGLLGSLTSAFLVRLFLLESGSFFGKRGSQSTGVRLRRQAG